MSYILDALKKAESDRKLGSVPNIHTHAAVAAGSDRRASRSATRWMWAALALLVSGLLAIVWRQPWQAAPVALSSGAPARPSLPKVAEPPLSQPPVPKATEPMPPPAAVTTTAVAAPLVPPQPPVPKVTESAPLPTAATSTIVATPRAAKSAQPRSGPATTGKTNNKPAEDQLPQPVVAAAARPDKTVARPPEPAPEIPAAAEPRVPNLRELPQNIQAELPPLAVTGYIYSKKEADRSVLINNKLLHEGDQAAPGVVLEKMTPKEAILNYKGYRYRLSY